MIELVNKRTKTEGKDDFKKPAGKHDWSSAKQCYSIRRGTLENIGYLTVSINMVWTHPKFARWRLTKNNVLWTQSRKKKKGKSEDVGDNIKNEWEKSSGYGSPIGYMRECKLRLEAKVR